MFDSHREAQGFIVSIYTCTLRFISSSCQKRFPSACFFSDPEVEIAKHNVQAECWMGKTVPAIFEKVVVDSNLGYKGHYYSSIPAQWNHSE
jgi:hypothetical protein